MLQEYWASTVIFIGFFSQYAVIPLVSDRTGVIPRVSVMYNIHIGILYLCTI